MRLLTSLQLGASLAAAVLIGPNRSGGNVLITRATDRATCKLTTSNGAYVGGVLHEGFGPTSSCAPSKGLLNTFMFFIDFADQPARRAGNNTPNALKDFYAPSIS